MFAVPLPTRGPTGQSLPCALLSNWRRGLAAIELHAMSPSFRRFNAAFERRDGTECERHIRTVVPSMVSHDAVIHSNADPPSPAITNATQGHRQPFRAGMER